jgi:hypothetical protein
VYKRLAYIEHMSKCSKNSKSKLVKSARWSLFAMSIVLIGWFMPEFSPERLKYTDMRTEDLRGPAIRFSPIDFLSENVKERQTELTDEMKLHCTDDVLFAFQFSKHNRTVQDHIFMLCGTDRLYANAEVIDHGDEYVMCTERYADIKQRIKRYSEVVIKAIDVESWDVVEYKSTSVKESCTLQHAIDVLNSNWV